MRLLLLAIPSLLLASCQSMSEGVLAFEARAVVIDDADIDDVENGSAFEEENIDISSYGVHAALKTPVVDLLVGVDDREFGKESSAELVLGVRRRFLEIWKLHPYLEADYRHGFDLDLTYITDRVIAMAAPTFGQHSAYRNDVYLVARYLAARHYGAFLVLNLCDTAESSDGERACGSAEAK